MTTLAPPESGLISHNADEIARVLETAKTQRVPVRAYLSSLTFQSLLLFVDAKAGRIVLERSQAEDANQALLSRPRCDFHCELAGWHIEFVAAEPRAVVHYRRDVIQCRFPDVLATLRRRHERFKVKPPLPLRVEADAAGITPFDAVIIDIGLGGIGFMIYAGSITLEPGTRLRGCRVQLPGGHACVTDLEVRYSEAVTLPNGRRAMRSGCRFVNPSPEVQMLVRRYLK